jgi:hypothetical protein
VPIHNLGYRPWQGELESAATRWTVVAGVGIRRAWQSSWLRRIMFVAWLPTIYMGAMIFLYEQSEKNNEGAARRVFLNFARGMPVQSGDLTPRTDRSGENLNTLSNLLDVLANTQLTAGEQRHAYWSALLLNLFRNSQPFMLIPIVSLIAPPLISQDIRSRAFLLYFSRPLGRVQYILGKAATVIAYLAWITLLPALLLILAGVLLSPELSVVKATWDLPLRVLFVSLAIVIPSTSLALALSSLTTESRYASFGWFAIWIFGFITYNAVVPFSAVGTHSFVECLSLFHVFSDVAGWILDSRLAVHGAGTKLLLLIALTAVSLAIVYRRVSAPMKV